jgi:hypothetical protein
LPAGRTPGGVAQKTDPTPRIITAAQNKRMGRNDVVIQPFTDFPHVEVGPNTEN